MKTIFVEITLEVDYFDTSEAVDVARRVTEVARLAIGGLDVDDAKLLHDVPMYGARVLASSYQESPANHVSSTTTNDES